MLLRRLISAVSERARRPLRLQGRDPRRVADVATVLHGGDDEEHTDELLAQVDAHGETLLSHLHGGDSGRHAVVDLPRLFDRFARAWLAGSDPAALARIEHGARTDDP